MAIGASVVTECRAATGSNTNGGGYTSGGIDFSQQASPVLSVSDGVANGTNTLISETGGFTAAMIGNLMYNSGTATWYEIATYVDTNEITVDRNVTTGTGLTFNVGGALAFPSSTYLNLLDGGGRGVWIKDDGASTFTTDWNITVDGDATLGLMNWIHGYNTTRGDRPSGTDRPLLDMGVYRINLTSESFWNFAHLRSTGTDTYHYNIGTNTLFESVGVTHTGVTANRAFRVAGTDAAFVNCDVSMTDASPPSYAGAIEANGKSRITVSGCYLHDSGYGADVGA
jgi:hypothetical protein